MRRNSFCSNTRAVLALVFASAGLSHAACVPKNRASPAPQDPVARVLSQQNTCPKNAMEFVDILKRAGVRIPVNWSTDSGGSGPASESLTQV